MSFKAVKLNDSAISTYGADSAFKKIEDYQSVNEFKNENKRFYKRVVKDSKVFDAGFNVLHNTLAKIHTTPVEPKFYFTYGKDVPIETGGGFVDAIEYQVLNFAGINGVDNFFNNQANIIPRVNASMIQKTAKVFTYEVAYDLKYMELEKLQKANNLMKSITQVYNDIIMVGFDLWMQQLCYLGFEEVGVEGLFNNSKVMVHSIPAATGGGNDGLDKYTNEEIIALFNGIIAESLVATNFNVDIIPDTLLIPLKDFKVLNDRTSDISFGKNLYNYLIENNMATALEEVEGFKLKIKARKQLDTMGTNSNGRIVAYRMDSEFVRIDLTQPLKVFLSMPNIERAAETTIFAGQASEIQLPYNESAEEVGIVSYWDFGA